jgi:hypothetical protein
MARSRSERVEELEHAAKHSPIPITSQRMWATLSPIETRTQ